MLNGKMMNIYLKAKSGFWNYDFNNKNMWLSWDWQICLGLELPDDDLNMFEKWRHFEIHKIVAAYKG